MTYKMLIAFFVLSLGCTPYILHADELSLTPPVNNSTDSAPVLSKNGAVNVQKITFENNALQIVTDGRLNSFSSFKLARPARLVVDMPGVANQLSATSYTGTSAPLSSVNVVQYDDKLRLIIEASESPVFPETEINSTATGLVITASDKHKPAALPAKSSFNASESRKRDEGPLSKSSPLGAVTSRGHVSSVNVEQSGDTSRIIMNLYGNCPVSDPQLVINGISVTFADCIVPANLEGIVALSKDHPIINSITLFAESPSKRVEAGMLVELKQKTKLSFSKEKQRLIIDLNSDDASPSLSLATRSASSQKEPAGSMKIAALANDAKNDHKKFGGKKVSIDFDNAELRQVFRLLADVSGENFVIADDVKGLVSIKLKDVPWEHALEIIIRNNNLAVEHIGNVIEIISKQKKIERDKIENDIRLEETRQKLEEKAAKEIVEGMATKTIQLKHASADKMAKALIIMLSEGSANVNTGQGQQQAQQQTQGQGQSSSTTSSDISRKFSASIFPEPNTNKIIVRDYISKITAIEKLVKELDVPERQVMIEARIVVATSEFTRDFGIQWGAHARDRGASFMGINSMDTGFGGLASAPPAVGQLGGSSGFATGISFGKLSSNVQLDMRLSAATAANTVKVIASPKISTLNNESAKIEQGQSTFVQTVDKLGVPSMSPVTATLKLDVTPSINSNNDSLKLKIDASDDSFSVPPSGATSVAINKRTASSTLLLKDGETAVIGGIFREQNSDSNSGVPFLKDIPGLGFLFQSSSSVNKREELLIFIRPKIIDLI